MAITALASGIALTLGVSIGKFLLKNYLGEFATAVGGGLIDFGKDKLKDTIKDERAARKAEREYEQIGDAVVKQIENDLQSAILGMDEPRPDANKLARRFHSILSGKMAATFVIRNQINPQKLADALCTTPVPNAEPLSEAEQKLFAKTAHQVAQYLFRAASSLPQFDAAREEESVATLSQLANEVSEVLEDTRAIRDQVVSRPLTDEIDYETSYRNAVVAELDKVELFGVDLPPELKDARLTDAYVTLRLRCHDERDENEEDDDDELSQDDDNPATLTAEEAFDRLKPGFGRMLIRGGAGCGKTTLVRWAAMQAARGTSLGRRTIPEFERTPDGDIRLLHEDEQLRITNDWRRRMPFVITLRNCPEGKLPPPDEFPAQIGNEVGHPPPQWVDRLLRNGQALILIDGIDEVAKLNHKDLYASVNRLIKAFHKDNYIVLTTRPDAVANVRFEDLEFIPSDIEPLEDKDRELFIQHWFDAVSRKLKYSAKQTQELQDEAKAIAKLIGQTPWLAQLATTPLYCAMTCALYRARRGTLPHGLRAMCETLCEMMVDRRDRERKITLDDFPKAYAQLDYPQKKLLLRRLAHYFIMAGRSAIPVPDAIEQIGKALTGMMQRDPKEAGDVFAALVVRSGMLRSAAPATETRPATVQFVHNTFKEFLAGEQLADEANADFLVKQLADETWRRVGLFAISAGNAKYQNAVLQAMLSLIPDPLPRERKMKGMTDIEIANTPRDRAIYAYRCGVLGNEWLSEVKDRLNRLTEELFPPKSLTEAEWLASAGNAAIPHLKILPKSSGSLIAACIRALKLIGTPEAIDAIRTYQDDLRQAVVVELAKALPDQVLTGIMHHLRANSLPWQGRAFIANEVLRAISPFKGLMLNLRRTRVSDLTPLRNLTQLQWLDLNRTSVSDLTPLQNLTQLQSLDLGGTFVSDLTPLRNLAKLQSLNLGGTFVSDFTLLQNFTELQSLNLEETSVSNLTPLRNLTQLQSLDLNRTSVSDLTPLHNLAQLQLLGLGNTSVSDLTPLHNLTQLRMLDLWNTRVTHEQIDAMKKACPKLTFSSVWQHRA